MIGKQIGRQPPLTNPIDAILADVAIRVQLNRTHAVPRTASRIWKEVD